MVKKTPNVLIYTDGACMGNPGPGGWAAILRDTRTGKELKISGAEAGTTNNRMELMAVIRALEKLREPCRVTLVSDSQYVVKGLNEWMAGWQRRSWRTADGAPVKNRDLWERLFELKTVHVLECRWVEGHAGHSENEECDQMAKEAIDRLPADRGRS